MRYALAFAAAAALVTATTATSAASKHHPRYARHARAPAVVETPRSSLAAPHMIEARPGVFISSYGCITDEGYGRWTYCGQGRGAE
jgi:hypothetical protein